MGKLKDLVRRVKDRRAAKRMRRHERSAWRTSDIHTGRPDGGSFDQFGSGSGAIREGRRLR